MAFRRPMPPSRRLSRRWCNALSLNDPSARDGSLPIRGNILEEYYPILRGAAAFCQAVLVEDPKRGVLVTSPSNSPENKYFYRDQDGKRHAFQLCIGATHDLQADPGETTNLYRRHPEIVQRPTAQLDEHVRSGRSAPW